MHSCKTLLLYFENILLIKINLALQTLKIQRKTQIINIILHINEMYKNIF